MAQRQLELARIGQQLIPGLPGQLAGRFGQWATNWVRENPEDARQLARDAGDWIANNAPNLRNQAFRLANQAAENIRQATAVGGPIEQFFQSAGEIILPERRVRPRTETPLPDLQDLIPDSTMSSTNEPVTAQPEAAIMRAGPTNGGGGPNAVSKETPISPYPSLSYGLQETHTTILPYNCWISCTMANNTSVPQQLRIRTNAINDMLDLTVLTLPGGSGTSWTSAGFNQYLSTHDHKVANTAPYGVMGVGTKTDEQLQWRNYWEAIYEYYTVLGCEYEITLENPSITNGEDVLCAIQYDTYSDTATSTGNVMPVTGMEEIQYFKNIQYKRIPSNTRHTNDSIVVINGTYKPGQAKRNIVNDGDVKTWTKTDGSLPNLKEILTLNFVKHPMAWGTSYNVNIQIKLKYIVQFKDLKVQARYPNTLITNQDIIQTLNETKTASGAAMAIISTLP